MCMGVPRSKFGGGDPHNQAANEQQGVVSGCDELKEGEAAPDAVMQLIKEVSDQDKAAHEKARRGWQDEPVPLQVHGPGADDPAGDAPTPATSQPHQRGGRSQDTQPSDTDLAFESMRDADI